MTTKTAISSTELLNSFGVATHIDYTDGSYASIDKALNALKYIGVDQVRDASPIPSSDPFGQGHLGDAAAAGVKFTFLAQGGEDPADVVARLHQFVTDHPGSISAIEGPNEVNNWPVTYNGLTGAAGAQAYQQALFDGINADPLLKDVPVLGFTDYPFHASASDFNNIHPYSNSGDQPRDAIISNLDQQLAVDPGKPFMITEMGYHTGLQAPGGWEAVDQNVQAKLTLNALMDSADLGSTRSFLYELLDEQPDPSGSDQQAHFGLFTFDGAPKMAATALHNLTSILSDPGAGQGVTSGSLNYDVQGMPTNGHSLLTVKSDGSYQIVAWNEPDLWDQNANAAITPDGAPVKVDLGQTFNRVEVYDPMVGPNPVATYSSVSSVDLTLNGHPLVVQVMAGSGSTDVTTPASATTGSTATSTLDTTAVVSSLETTTSHAGSGAISDASTSAPSGATDVAPAIDAHTSTSGAVTDTSTTASASLETHAGATSETSTTSAPSGATNAAPAIDAHTSTSGAVTDTSTTVSASLETHAGATSGTSVSTTVADTSASESSPASQPAAPIQTSHVQSDTATTEQSAPTPNTTGPGSFMDMNAGQLIDTTAAMRQPADAHNSDWHGSNLVHDAAHPGLHQGWLKHSIDTSANQSWHADNFDMGHDNHGSDVTSALSAHHHWTV